MAGIHFNPELIGYNGQGAFRFWCQKVLPLVYDDSLSYYELLCKVVKYLNNTNEDVKLLGNSYLKLVEFVNGYFDNLDVTSEVNQKLDEMVESGELDDVIASGVSAAAMQATEQQLPGVVAEQIDAVVAEQIDGAVAGQIDEAVDSAVSDKIDSAVESQIDGAVAGQIDGVVGEQIGPAVLEQSGGLAAPAVTEWLEQNVVPQGSAVVVDESLSVQGAAADALYTGTGIRALENEFVWDNSNVEFEVGEINSNTGESASSTVAIRTVNFIEGMSEVKCNNGYLLEAYAYNKNTDAFVGGYRAGGFTIGESGQDTIIGLPSYYKYKIVLQRAGATTANPTTIAEKENAYFLLGTDTTLSLSNKAADAKAVGDALDELASRPGLTDEAKLALLNCFAHVAWIDEHGQDYYDELETALMQKTLESITAVFVQGDNVIYDTDSLDDLKPMLTVTAHYTDGTSATVTAYTLSGTLSVGTSTITVSYGGKTATFDVVVTAFIPTEYQRVEYIEGTGAQYIDTGYHGEFAIDAQVYKDFSVFNGTQDTLFGCQNSSSPWGSVLFRRASISDTSENRFLNQFIVFSGQPRATPWEQNGNMHIVAHCFADIAKLVVNDTTIQNDPLSGATVNNWNLFIMAMNTGGTVDQTSFATMKLYGAKIYSDKAMNVLVREFVPCYRKSDGVIGVFDRVGNQFYINSGTGAFGKGADILRDNANGGI